LKIQILDFYRGIAILLVFIHHILYATFGTYQFDIFDAGVPIFFVISGFCIHLSFTQNPSWHSFFNKRFFRIYPPYFVALVLFILIYNEHEKSLRSILYHTLLIHNYVESSFYRINPSFWSIAIEMQLYMIYPVLIILLRNISWKNILFLTGTIEFAIRIFYLINPIHSVYYSPFGFWFSWTLGVYLANLYLTNNRIQFSGFQITLVIILLS
jgi:peptidoglycan/LPS O-acetylase OafA/YrhL